MIKRLFFIFILFLFSSSTFALDKIEDIYKNIQSYKLNNGLQVYLLSDEKSKNVTINLKVKVGSVVEDEKNAGLTHLVEHLVFRDQRIPHKDYLDYFEENGATFVNAYTSRYETKYVFDMLSSKAEFLLTNLSTMIFDKNITNVDLINEKGALQTEIGENTFIGDIFWNIRDAYKLMFPDERALFYNAFGLKKDKKSNRNIEQINNKKFTLDDVMEHYNKYYYASNMVLSISGNFDIQKIKTIIKNNFEKYDKKGQYTVPTLKYNAKLNNKPFIQNGYNNANKVNLGYKVVNNTFISNLVMKAYMKDLAKRLQQKLRNKSGKTYSVNSYYFNKQNAFIYTINLSGLHENLMDNKKYIENFMREDIQNIDDELINKIRKSVKKEYLSIEHESRNLMNLIDEIHSMKTIFNNHYTPIELFSKLTNAKFKSIIQSKCDEKNKVLLISKEYEFFPYDTQIFFLLDLILTIYLIIIVLNLLFKKKNNLYKSRKVLLSRRLSNKIFLILPIFLTLAIYLFLYEWFSYFMFDLIFDNPYYVNQLLYPEYFLIHLMHIFTLLVVFIYVYTFINKSYFARFDLTKRNIYLIGVKMTTINKEEIKDLEVVNWNMKMYFRIYGSNIMFWKELLRITLKNGQVYYCRSNNAKELKEDILDIYEDLI